MVSLLLGLMAIGVSAFLGSICFRGEMSLAESTKRFKESIIQWENGPFVHDLESARATITNSRDYVGEINKEFHRQSNLIMVSIVLQSISALLIIIVAMMWRRR